MKFCEYPTHVKIIACAISVIHLLAWGCWLFILAYRITYGLLN